ncbi:MAG: GNAT family N-acetyltransferase [Lachnospiraceae bacterium]|nr:GNAT family N-acetyltransferase [Lachnospiraceae bacterium]
MSVKEQYKIFEENNYIPIYSRHWWMDAVCEAENWNVWVYEKEGDILAAMPYYIEKRGKYKYITKAPLTQNNGLIFKACADQKRDTMAKFQEHVIDAVNKFIESLNLDVYEQQYHYSFDNWMPFLWNGYTAITRYTYVIEDTSNIEEVWEGMSSNYRKNIKKGYRIAHIAEGHDKDEFWNLHKKVFEKQGLECPFSYDLWTRLYNACMNHGCGKILYAKDDNSNILSILFLVWDEQSVYHLLGGSMPEYQHLQTYNMLTWEGIKTASEMGLKYDFEGSVIKRISKSMRQFGGKPMPYFRIRKVFNLDIIRAEAEEQIQATCKKYGEVTSGI